MPCMGGKLLALALAAAASAAAAEEQPKPEREIRAEAIAELSESRFWNRSGATLDDYLAEWVDCYREVRGYRARGDSRSARQSPRGTGVRPPDLSTATLLGPPGMGVGAAAGLGAAVGLAESLFGSMAEADVRRDNRVACLVARGWRLYRPEPAMAARIRSADMSGRQALLAELVGAADPPHAEERVVYRNFAVPPEGPK